MDKFRWESQLYDPVSNYVRRKGYRRLAPEVPFYDYRIDIYAYSRTQELSIAIELKLTNWRKALQQALIYQLAADVAYAALPRYSITDAVVGPFSSHGIGLIAVGGTGRCEQIIAPASSGEVKDWYKEHLVALVTG